MPEINTKQSEGFIAGVLPRLLSGSIPMASISDLDQLKAEITANIESILNSRSRPSYAELNHDPQLHFSVIGMGLDDFCGSHQTDATIEKIRKEMKDQLVHFEPRLDPDSIVVTVRGEYENRRGSLIMDISGRINVKPFEGEYLCAYRLDLETGIPETSQSSDAS